MRHSLASCLVTAALATFASLAAASETHAPHWEYEGATGPEHWGELDAGFHTCEEGRQQSPFNVKATINADLPPIKFKYGSIPAAVLNNGHTIQVNAAEGNSMRVDGKTYQLAQFNFHTPSEYQIEGREFPLEIHFVHKDEKGALAVVGVMVEQGPINTELEKIFWNAPAAAGETVTAADTQIDLEDLLPKTRSYYRFMGSLTTPPCSEGVNWHMMTTPISASAAQIAKFHERFTLNARPLQMLNDRLVVRDID